MSHQDRWPTYLRAILSDRFPLWDDTKLLLIYLKLESRKGVTPPMTLPELTEAMGWKTNKGRLCRARRQAIMFLMLDWDLKVRADGVRACAYTVTDPARWGVRGAKPCKH